MKKWLAVFLAVMMIAGAMIPATILSAYADGEETTLGIYNKVIVQKEEKDGVLKNTATIVGTIQKTALGNYDSLTMSLQFTGGNLTEPKNFTHDFTSVYSTVRGIASTNEETAASQGIDFVDDEVYLFALSIIGIDTGNYNVAITLTPNVGGSALTDKAVTSSIDFSEFATPELTGVSVGEAANVQFTLDAETGLYEGAFTLTSQWQFVHFDLEYSDGTTERLTFDNTTFAGDGIYNGAYWYTGTAVLYADGDNVAAGRFCYGKPEGSTDYTAVYNPATQTMTVNVVINAELTGVSVGGAAEAQFTLNSTTGKYEGSFSLTTQWQFVHFDLVYSDSSTQRLTFDNTTFAGDGIYNGAYWYTGTAVLYSDGDHVAVGEFCYGKPDGTTDYTATYDPTTQTMTVNVVINAELTGVSVGGAAEAQFTLNSTTGKYEGSFSLTTQWQFVHFDLIYSDSSTERLTFDNTTFAGDGIYNGPYWYTGTALLYSDGDHVALGEFCYGKPEGTTEYTATYDPDTQTLTVNVVVNAQLTGVSVGEAANVQFVLNSETGLYEGRFTLTSQWQFVHFDLLFEDNSTVRLTYDNTTFTGNGIKSEKASGATMNAMLFSDTDAQVTEGRFCYSISDTTEYAAAYDPATQTMTVNVYVPEPTGELTGVSVGGAASAQFTLNTTTGKYEGAFTLTSQWQFVHFDLAFSDNSTLRLTFDNTTFTGSGIHHGAYWYTGTEILYADGDHVAAGEFCYGKPEGSTDYTAAYDPDTQTLTVNVVVPDPTGELTGVSVGDAANVQFTLNSTTGKYEGNFTLTSIWQFVHFDLAFSDSSTQRLTFDNTTFAGDGIYNGAYWYTGTQVLYADGDHVALGEFCYGYPDGTTTYTAVYDPDTQTMTVNVVAS